MAEVLVEFTESVEGSNGKFYMARACGRPMPDGMWQGWIEFVPVAGGEALRSARETTQPNRDDAVYWATGLTQVYLEGALERASKPLARPREGAPSRPAYDGPAEDFPSAPVAESILNPFSVYRKGEVLLRSQLAALSSWHLVNIIRAYELSDLEASVLNAMTAPALIELIVASVRAAVVSSEY